MRALTLEPEVIDPGELGLLLRFAPAAVLIGAAAGFLVSIGLWGEDVISQSFWSETLKIVGVAALPLIALAVRMTRPRSLQYQRTALLYLVVGFAAAIGVILLCLFNIAVFPKDGIKAEDWQVTVALLGVGVTVGALAVGVAAEVLDKVDTLVADG
jgi:uncharacterized membrane protein